MLIDRDVAELYGVETKRVNEAVKNNPDKFPKGYFFTLQGVEKQQLVENFDHFETSETESSLEINFLIGEIKHTVKRVRKGDSK